MYMPATIDVDTNGNGAFFGDEAQPFVFKPHLRQRLNELVEAAKRSSNRYFVLKGTVLMAAQTSRLGALAYMSAGRVLVSVETA